MITAQVDDGFIAPEVRQAMQQNQALAEQVRAEARRRLSAAHLAQLDQAVTNERDARIALHVAQQPPRLTGDTRERGLQRLEWEERQRAAQQQYEQAAATLERLRCADALAERDALTQVLHEAERAKAEAHAAVQRHVGGAWNTQMANVMLAANPAIEPLLVAERAANDRAMAIAKAIQTLYQ